MAQRDPFAAAHQEWLDLVQPVGLVVSPPALVSAQAILPRNVIDAWRRLRELSGQDDGTYAVTDLAAFGHEFLDWHDAFLASDEATIATLTVPLPEFGDRLEPDFAVRDPEKADKWLLLAQAVELGANLDNAAADHGGARWRASPQARFERLLRSNGVPIGVLSNGRALRLVYAPQGESSGYVTFHLHQMAEVGGRPMLAALLLLLGSDRLFSLPDNQRLPHLLRESRKYQNTVTQRLAEQVLSALGGLLAGFQAADQQSRGTLLRDTAPAHIYEGLLGSILRTIFLLFAEERGVLPADEAFLRSYSVLGLYERLRADAALHPDTMDQRFSAWPQLLTLWRILHDGAQWTTADGHALHLPPRHGRLFDPDAWPFLEGRTSTRQLGETLTPPRVADSVVLQLLNALLLLDEERLSYRALDVEQIGSVYESMMGFVVQTATGPSIGLRPDHVVVNLDELLAETGVRRATWLKDHAKCEPNAAGKSALAGARNVDDLLVALSGKISPRTPQVIPLGGRFLQPTEERRRTGAHYTPPSLTEPIVKKTLEPLLADLGAKPTPEQILELKICDPAMGSGAFLVQACKQLADLLVAAWNAHGKLPAIPPDEEPVLHARRLVAQRCLYGVDKNPVAVDLAKLSVWLVTLAKDHPFTFLDHALRHGDSLVGLTREQIACFDWEVGKQIPMFRKLVQDRVQEGMRLREEVLAAGDVADQTEIQNTWKFSDQQLADVRMLGDVCVAAFFGAEKPAAREGLRQRYQEVARRWLEGGHPGELLKLSAELRQGERPVVPFHWEIEFPEVFGRERPGFDGFVGNPPFLGGTNISTRLGTEFLDWLLGAFERTGNRMDLVAYFFRHAFKLLRTGGTLGLVATNTICQGDTRTGGLTEIRNNDGWIYAATRRVKWPGLAAVVVSVVHVRKSRRPTSFVLDGKDVPDITSFLFHGGGDADPHRLESSEGLCFEGFKIAGNGFLFDDRDLDASPLAEKERILQQDPTADRFVFPYLGGEEVFSDPRHEHHRFAINFGRLGLEDAEQSPGLMDVVRRKVKPYRDTVKRDAQRERWWQYGETRPGLVRALAGKKRVLVVSGVCTHLCFAWLPSTVVFSHALNVVTSDRPSAFGVLQARAHEVWARFFGSSMKDDLRYTPTDCFETFPFPPKWQTNPTLESIGARYYQHRADLMIRHNEGLTTTYNRFHDPDEQDPDILELRRLHDEMDRAVLDAYGWTDVRPVCQFLLDHEPDEGEEDAEPGKRKRRLPWRYRWSDEVRDEVLARLLELNAVRAREEAVAGAGSEKAAKGGKKAKAAATSGGQGSLF